MPDVDGPDRTSLASSLMLHIAQKGWQLGSILGVALVGPAVYMWKGRPASPAQLLASTSAYTALIVTGASTGAGLVKTSGIDIQGLDDRVFRLRHNESQNRTDAFSAVGGALGAAAAAYFFAERTPLLLVGGAAAGSALGVAAHVLTRPAEQKSANKMVHELTRED